jgi:hypothetical protein
MMVLFTFEVLQFRWLYVVTKICATNSPGNCDLHNYFWTLTESDSNENIRWIRMIVLSCKSFGYEKLEVERGVIPARWLKIQF